MPTERRPNLFIVGAQKSGTSALAGLLGQHPEILMSFPKEPGYLAFGEAGYWFPDGYGRPCPARDWVVRSEAEYLALFAQATSRQKFLAEASTWYFAIPGMAQRIYDYNPDSRIIVCLRNPVERAYSGWCHARRDNQEPCDNFAMALELERDRGEVSHLLRYRQMGSYSGPLREYQAVFAPSSLLVLFYQDFRDKPEMVWQQICEFLGVDATLEMPVNRSYNRSGQPRSRLVQSIASSHRIKRVLLGLLPKQILVFLKQKVDSVNLRKFPPMEENVRLRLVDYYRPEIEDLMEITGRDLSDWLQ